MHCGQLGLTEITGGSNSGATVRLAATLRHHAWGSTPLQNASLLAFATVIFYFGFIFDVPLFLPSCKYVAESARKFISCVLTLVDYTRTNTHTHTVAWECMNIWYFSFIIPSSLPCHTYHIRFYAVGQICLGFFRGRTGRMSNIKCQHSHDKCRRKHNARKYLNTHTLACTHTHTDTCVW